MDNTLSSKLISLTKVLEDHKCQDISLLDLTGNCSWADAFIIATVNSKGHLKGVLKHLLEAIAELDLTVFRQPKNLEDDGWILVDCGDFLIHLMDKDNREFYDLEKLWYFGEKIKLV